MATDDRLQVFDKDNTHGDDEPFWRYAAPGRKFAGDFSDLDDREVEWNDRIRSVVLYGSPGTTVWLYDKKGFKGGDDILEIKIPDGSTSVRCNDLNHLNVGMRWVQHKNGVRGKVSGIKWK